MKKILSNKWLIAIVTILLTIILRYYITKEKTDTFFEYIISIPHLTIKLLTYKIPFPIWIILLILGFVVLLIARINSLSKHVSSSSPQDIGDLINSYKTDIFYDLRVYWEWDNTNDGKYYPGNLSYRCPDHPSVELDNNEGGYYPKYEQSYGSCSICGNQFKHNYLWHMKNKDRLRKIIVHNLTSGDRGLPKTFSDNE